VLRKAVRMATLTTWFPLQTTSSKPAIVAKGAGVAILKFEGRVHEMLQV
jgi:hypothetical protein